jgi:periplasmic divalent cation tolerance protein
MNETLTLLCTCPDEETAERLARGMLENRHCACVNILPKVRSIYRLHDEIKDEQEVLMIIKTTSSHFFVIENWLEEHHPYDVPELVALKAEHVADGYLKWLRQTVSA